MFWKTKKRNSNLEGLTETENYPATDRPVEEKKSKKKEKGQKVLAEGTRMNTKNRIIWILVGTAIVTVICHLIYYFIFPLLAGF